MMALLAAAAIVAGAASLANEPLTVLGDSIQSVTERLGTPEHASYELLTSRQGATNRDVRATLSYPSLQVSVLIELCCGRSRIESVTLHDPGAADLLGIELPETATGVRKMLGAPPSEVSPSIDYRVDGENGRATITFDLDGDRVRAVRWVYAID